ncbi:uncharacterized protein N7515_001351 [Penicillium bovifimosum]|uniref:Allergen Asp f 4 n=1 Tax=Penicillium bovifimosum TaxID=126998 RepID=A0A9W9H9P0_9EURO|nr:uncharacterized protein N7515_001351 [Penicillium bovifimosum]KAJ5142564.1 hypothetical protein N7515_001351 [Penicillium bovifimosum]
MRSASIPFLLAGFVGYAFAGLHHHHAHLHRHRHLMPPAENLEPRALAVANVPHLPDDFVVESVTRTTTTTVYGKCAPISTIHSTLTLVREGPEPTLYKPDIPEPFQKHWYQLQQQAEAILPAPTNIQPAQTQFTRPTEPEETTTSYKTKTITKTATNTVRVTANPGAGPAPPANTASESPNAGKAIPLADTLPGGLSEEAKSVPAKGGPAPAHRPKTKVNGPIDTVLGLPGQVLPDLPVVNEILPGQKPETPPPVDWTALPPKGQFSTKGFGGRTQPSPPQEREINYRGNVGKPWGSNIILVSPAQAHLYKYVAQFTGSNNEPWTVVVWNKIGPDGKLTGWYGHSALTFTLAPGETRYVAFDEDSEGAWGAAPGGKLPTDQWGGYSCTWGEFSFGDGENNGWSGWDVSAIQAQVAEQHVQGMSICQADGKGCSVITTGAGKVVDAYIKSKKHVNGIGGAAAPGPVRLKVVLDYRG